MERHALKNKISQIQEKIVVFGKMIKFSHTIFALPFALSAALLAYDSHPFGFSEIFWVIFAMVCARSAAMGVNRVADADIDGRNPRTAGREIPSGKLSRTQGILFTLLFSAGFVFSSAMLGELPLKLSLPFLFFISFYSYTKRFTWLCHVYLGFSISLAPLGAWIALTDSVTFPAVALSMVLWTYITGFDILYACQDTDFDRKEGLFSMPVHLGVEKSLKISSLMHVASTLFLLVVYWGFGLGIPFLVTVFIIALLFIAEHMLVKPNDLKHVNIAFFHINSVISVVLFAGIVVDKLV